MVGANGLAVTLEALGGIDKLVVLFWKRPTTFRPVGQAGRQRDPVLLAGCSSGVPRAATGLIQVPSPRDIYRVPPQGCPRTQHRTVHTEDASKPRRVGLEPRGTVHPAIAVRHRMFSNRRDGAGTSFPVCKMYLSQ